MPVVQRLDWADQVLAEVDTPKDRLVITAGVGSGLAGRAGDPPGRFWALGDRGPNLKAWLAVERYGLSALAALGDVDGAKIMPRPEIGPALTEIEVADTAVRLLRRVPLHVGGERTMTGLPLPAGDSASMEPAYRLDGSPLQPDAAGADTEGVVALADGTFRVAEEYGPSILVVDGEGRVTARWLPERHALGETEAGCPVPGALPQLASRRRLNRGFEALALSPDERWLYAVFQSALAGEDDDRPNQVVRIWRLDAHTGAVDAQWLYPMDAPDTFRRDVDAGEVRWRDGKVCDALCLPDGRLLVLERLSHTGKLYVVTLPKAGPCDLDTAWEGMAPDDRVARACPIVDKTLLFSTDDAPEIAPDLEGVALLDARTLLLVNDNDFGVEGVETEFWRVRFDAAI